MRQLGFVEIWSTWEVFLRIFRAYKTSRVLHISMNARWRMNQLLIDCMLCNDNYVIKSRADYIS